MTFTVTGSRFLITGAAMGMGRLYAERAVAEGAETVILWDINKEALTETTKALRVHADNTQEIVPMLVDIAERGAIEKAAAKYDVDMEASWMVGDHERDIIAGTRAGLRTIRLAPKATQTNATHLVDDLRAATQIILA